MLAIALLLVQTASAGGSKFVDETQRISATFPCTPDRVEEAPVDRTTTVKVSCQDGEVVYLLSWTAHEEVLPNPDTLLDVSVDGFRSRTGPSMVVETQGPWRVGRFDRGRHVLMVDDSADLMIAYHVLIADRRHVQVVVGAPMADYDAKAVKRFTKSVKLGR